MSLVSIIDERVSEKCKEAIQARQVKFQAFAAKLDADLKPKCDKFEKQIDKLVGKAKRFGLEVATNYRNEVKVTVNHNLIPAYKKANQENSDLNNLVYRKFDRFRDQAEIVALLPAKERRAEFAKLLADLDRMS